MTTKKEEKATPKRHGVLSVRVKTDDYTRWQAEAEKAGKSLTEWVEKHLNAAVKK